MVDLCGFVIWVHSLWGHKYCAHSIFAFGGVLGLNFWLVSKRVGWTCVLCLVDVVMRILPLTVVPLRQMEGRMCPCASSYQIWHFMLTSGGRPLECARAHEHWLSTGRVCNTHQPKVGQRNATEAGCCMAISDLAAWVYLYHTYPGTFSQRFEFFRMSEYSCVSISWGCLIPENGWPSWNSLPHWVRFSSDYFANTSATDTFRESQVEEMAWHMLQSVHLVKHNTIQS